MKNCLIKLNQTICGKKVKFELGIDTQKDPTKRFRFARWYIECYVYDEDDNHCCSTKNFYTYFHDAIDLIKDFDDDCDLDGGLWKEVQEAMSKDNTELYKKIFNAIVYSDFADVINLSWFGFGIEDNDINFHGFEMEERKGLLRIHRPERHGFDRKYIATFKDCVLRIAGNDDNDSPFGYWDYVHLFQLKHYDFYWTFAEGKYKLQHPTPIFSDGENLIGIEFKAEAVEE